MVEPPRFNLNQLNPDAYRHLMQMEALIAETGASSEAYEALKGHFSAEEIGWLILAAVQINSWNRVAISSRSQYDPAMFGGTSAKAKETETA
jgi:hypothetical protein